MKNYVIGMFSEYGNIWRFTTAWMRKYWVGYLIMCGIVYAGTYIYVTRTIYKY